MVGEALDKLSVLPASPYRDLLATWAESLVARDA
jgi:hypothetical protein